MAFVVFDYFKTIFNAAIILGPMRTQVPSTRLQVIRENSGPLVYEAIADSRFWGDLLIDQDRPFKLRTHEF